jgi:hypothetical protein
VVRNDGTAVPGWPIDFGDDDTYVSMGPVLNMALNQIVIAAGADLHVMTAAGTGILGFPVPHPSGGIPMAAPSIGDIDNDGSTDIVVAGSTTVMAYRNDGSLIFSRSGLLGPVSGAAALGDLDGNGDLEIAVPTQGRVYVLEHNGSDRTGWPTSSGINPTAIAIANTRSTGELEVVYESSWKIYMHEHNGALYPGFPVTLGPPGAFSGFGGVAVDAIDEGSADILLGAAGLDSLARAVTNFGLPVTGWPKHLYSGAATALIPAVGDIDVDGSVEAVFLSEGWMNILDMGAAPGPAVYRWPMYGYDARRTNCHNCLFSSTVGVRQDQPAKPLSLAAPAPNPAPGSTTLAYDLPADAAVRLEIFDVSGRLVSVLVREEQPAGRHHSFWNGTDRAGHAVGSGVYFARLRTFQGGVVSTRTRRINLIRSR